MLLTLAQILHRTAIEFDERWYLVNIYKKKTRNDFRFQKYRYVFKFGNYINVTNVCFTDHLDHIGHSGQKFNFEK